MKTKKKPLLSPGLIARAAGILRKGVESPGVCRYLDASTAHMSKIDALNFGSECKPSRKSHIIFDAHGEYGWWVHVSDDPADDIKTLAHGMSRAFIGVIRHARANGCNWVLFDRDADHIPGLPTFNW